MLFVSEFPLPQGICPIGICLTELKRIGALKPDWLEFESSWFCHALCHVASEISFLICVKGEKNPQLCLLLEGWNEIM